MIDHVPCRTAASQIMAMVYDSLPIKDHNDPLIVRVNDLVQRLVKAAYPGEHLVEFFPWMQRLPNWLAPWKPWAEEWHRKDSEMFLQYYKEVRDRVVRVIASEQYIGGSDFQNNSLLGILVRVSFRVWSSVPRKISSRTSKALGSLAS